MEFLTVSMGFIALILYITNKSISKDRDWYKAECIRRMRYKNPIIAETELARLKSKKDS